MVAGVLAVVLGTVVASQGTVDLLDPGALVRWGAPIATTLSELATAVTIGALVLAAFVLPRTGGRTVSDGAAWPAAIRVAAFAAGAWTVLALADLVLGYGVVAGRPLDSPTFGPELGVYVTSISLGKIGLGVVVVAALTSVVAIVVRTPTGALWTALLATVALVLQAQTGHASGDTNHELAISAMFLHLLGVVVWIGGLAALALVAHRLGRDLAPSVSRYSTLALWAFVGVGASGVVNAAIRLGGPADLVTTEYGRLVSVKVLLMAALGVIGWVHRRRVVDRLAAQWRDRDPREPGGRLRAPWLFWRLVAVELVIMGAVSGVAVALSSAEPPVPQTPTGELTPAEIVTGHPLPAPPTADQWVTAFRWDLIMALAAVSGIVVYLRWVLRLRARGDHWSVGRTISWVVGMLTFFWATSGGPAVYGHVLLSAHMIEHMVLMLVVPIFLVISGPVTLAVRALPVRTDGSRGPREWLLAIVHSRWATFFANPLVAAANFAGSMYVFYFSELFRYSLETYIGHLAMVAHFSLAGYMFLNGMIGIDPGPKRLPHPMRLVLLFATMAAHAFFGVALTMDTALLVPEWYGLLGRTWGPSALDDQRTAGAIVWGISELPMLAVAIILAVSWTRADERAAKRRDRAAERDGDAELEAYNAMLAAMAERDREDPGPSR
ncbi:bifunctional copper resistance protein CopD/cytochrome c oxidase assembly protein [Actinotalea sp. M2MS4P-6]|uniref:bifunctional copper resistance protein CopD/cytochrome c oxidase assembly protein n=1 Tax=Actinotalea sp. M2MS4P-6 TaxID=2983762 RepID=UPI0021E401E4|nr:bifunctional copper resistance protein CopD/cytochrome c oxidase assembly protein [Actinotalea sp. M2MS4P-6]MCV2392930.1 bifunctional copper resistance protein CopD/cytochrome c oxidase assembly protein [Actinotalea sp. M2MS4P-6]